MNSGKQRKKKKTNTHRCSWRGTLSLQASGELVWGGQANCCWLVEAAANNDTQHTIELKNEHSVTKNTTHCAITDTTEAGKAR